MAPNLIGPAQQRQSQKLRATFQRAASKAVKGSICSSVLQSETDFHDTKQDFGPGSIGDTLSRKPEDRQPQAVREALDWWLESLPISGCELAQELRASDDSVLYEAFKRGRLSTCVRNQTVCEEGEEVKHFSFIVFGSCKLRCIRPKHDADDAADDAKSHEADGFLTLEILRRGDILPVFPWDTRVSYNIICAEKTSLLQLSRQDYESIFKKFHREIFEERGQFLKRVCPDATDGQLNRLAPLLRQKRVPRGKTFIHGGEYQRHIHILKSGACSVLVHDSPDGPAGAMPLDEEDQNEGENEVDRHDRLQQLRSTSYGPRMQQAAAFNEQRKDVLKGMARGPLRQSFAGGHHYAFRMSDGDTHASATVTEPGMMLGDEALVYDKFRDWVHCRSCYSVRASTDSLFMVADITAYRHIANLVGTKGLAHMVNDRLNRRCKQFARGKNVAKDLNKRVQELKANEFAKLNRQKLRLPRCTGYPPVDELENFEDYLGVVMDHRKPPPNCSSLPTLACLEGLPHGPKYNKNGPVVTALLKAAAEEADGRKPRRSNLSLRDWFEPNAYDNNPMGGTVSATARYAETAPPRSLAQLAIEDAMSTPALTRCESSPQIGGTGGVFLHTEVSFDDGMSLALEEKTMSTSISLPSLTQAHSLTGHDASKSEELSSIQKDTSKQSAPDRRAEARSAATRRHQRVMKAFTKAMSGKSILLLTEQKALRKQITSVLLKDDTNLRFIKTSNDLWPRLRDPKEQYHALLIDLTKSELPIEAILRTIRQDARYGNLPIVVLSSDRNLSDVVRACCSFVVFLPLAATMLREALVWCFDRASVQKLYQLEEEQLDLQCVRNFASGLNTSDAPLEVS